jgi:dihydroorotase
MFTYLKGGTVIDKKQNILIENDRIKEISDKDIVSLPIDTQIIDCTDKIIIPGVIDVHTHFREPGSEDKADMESESKAALKGGVTCVFDMPNNNPPIINIENLNNKLMIAKYNMKCNYGFYFGVSNTNIDTCLNLPKNYVCGLKLFLGSSTGNMLVDNEKAIEKLFKHSPFIITAHCEDEAMIKENIERFKGEKTLPYNIHALIRDDKECFKSSSYAISLAKKYGTMFHLAHISTEKEISLLSNEKIEDKRITSEVTPNHLFFCQEDYKEKQNLIKCNPSIKTEKDRQALRQALKEGYIDIIATDHAPHLFEEKQRDYFTSPSGIPSLQHSLLMMLQIMKEEKWDIRFLVEKMCENPAKRFHIKDRGFIKEGYFADIVIINPNKKTTVNKEDILYKCSWSPLEGKVFDNSLFMTIINGKIAFENGEEKEIRNGKKLEFS